MSDKYTLMRQHYRKKSDDTAGKSSLLRSWGDKDPLKRPSCALLVTLAQAILRHADAHTLTKMVSSRRGGCLHELSHTHTHTHIPAFSLQTDCQFTCLQPTVCHTPCSNSNPANQPFGALSLVTDTLVFRHAQRLHGLQLCMLFCGSDVTCHCCLMNQAPMLQLCVYMCTVSA